MFFIMGINNQHKKLEFNQVIICNICGQYGRLEVYRICTVLSLFFIPILKWGKKYYVKTTCCDSLYTMDAQLGKQIEKGLLTQLDLEQLQLVPNQKRVRTCEACGYRTQENFSYCPKCGKEMR